MSLKLVLDPIKLVLHAAKFNQSIHLQLTTSPHFNLFFPAFGGISRYKLVVQERDERFCRDGHAQAPQLAQHPDGRSNYRAIWIVEQPEQGFKRNLLTPTTLIEALPATHSALRIPERPLQLHDGGKTHRCGQAAIPPFKS